MITKVVLENFQSHRKTELVMGKLSMLTGGSNSGKSAALRGMIGALNNDAANNFVTDGEKTLCVTIHMSDGNVVEWHKGSGTNKYVLRTPQGEEETFDKPGTHVPEAVASVLGLTPIVMENGDKLHANVHRQLEAPFLIGTPPPQVAKVLGELTAASKLFAAVSEGNRRNREANAKRKIRKEDLATVQEGLAEYATLDQQVRLCEEATELTLAAKGKSSEADKLSTLTSSYAEVKTRIADTAMKLGIVKELADVDIEPLVEVSVRAENLEGFQTQYETVTAKLDKLARLEQPLTEAASVDWLGRVEELAAREAELFNMICTHDIGTNSIARLEEDVAKLAKADKAIERELNKLYEELDTCPACGQGLTAEEAKAHLLGEVLV